MDNEKNTKINPDQNQINKLKTLRTFQGDMQEYISKNNASITTIALAEQKRKEKDGVNDLIKKSESKNKFLFIFGIILFIVGIISILSVYVIQRMDNVVTVEEVGTIITFSEKTDIVSQNKQFVLSEIKNIIEIWNKPNNSILYINLLEDNQNTSKLKIGNVLEFVAPNIPQSLSRSLTDQYMFGVYSLDKNVPFIILKTKDFGISYSGMLRWEENILNDLSFIFNIPGQTSSYLFEDQTFRNRDLRIVKNEERKIILLYTFLDRETILITSNEEVFSSLLSKYINNQITR